MTTKFAARLAAAALAVASANVFAGCSSQDEIQHFNDVSKPLTDNDIFTATVASNSGEVEEAKFEQANGTNPDITALAASIQSDHEAALNRLIGASSPNDANNNAVAAGGLQSSAGLQLSANRLSTQANADLNTDIVNISSGYDFAGNAFADPSDPTGATPGLDCAYLSTQVDRHAQTLDNIAFFLGQGADGGAGDGGAVLTNDALRTELTTEQTTVEDHLNKLQTLFEALSAAPGDAPLEDGGVDLGGPCYLPPAE